MFPSCQGAGTILSTLLRLEQPQAIKATSSSGIIPRPVGGIALAERADLRDEVLDLRGREALAPGRHEMTFIYNVAARMNRIVKGVIGAARHFGGIGVRGWFLRQKSRIESIAASILAVTCRAVLRVTVGSSDEGIVN